MVENLLKSEAAFLTSLNIAVEVSIFFDKTDEVYKVTYFVGFASDM